MKKLLIVIVLSMVFAVPVAAKSENAKGPVPKVDVCHRTEGVNEYVLINISENSLPAHIEHGDGQPGEPVPGIEGKKFDEDCNVQTRIYSVPMEYSSTGWGGWSCPPEYPNAIAGGWLPADAVVGLHGVFEPGVTMGGFTYPNTPFGYVYGSWYLGEEGFILQNGGTGQTLTLWIDCQ